MSEGKAIGDLVGRQVAPVGSPAWSLPRWAVEAVDPDTADHPDIGFDAKAALRRIAPEKRDRLTQLATQVEAALASRRPIDTKPAVEALGRIGCRVQPGLPDDAASGWAASTLAALTRFDGGLVNAAIRDAECWPFKFLNEVHPWLHERCAKAEAKRLRTVKRLKAIAHASTAIEQPMADPEAVEALAQSLAAKERAIRHEAIDAFEQRAKAEPPRVETIMAARGCTREEAEARRKAFIEGRPA
jgi:hypothetical protein